MQILIFIIGLSLGIFLMSILQINRLNNLRIEIDNNYIHKEKIYKRIRELELNSKCTLDVKIHTLSDTFEYAKEELEKLL